MTTANPEITVTIVAEQFTLRDYFAAAVVTGLSAGLFGEIAATGMHEALALHAYGVADAMLAERAK